MEPGKNQRCSRKRRSRAMANQIYQRIARDGEWRGMSVAAALKKYAALMLMSAFLVARLLLGSAACAQTKPPASSQSNQSIAAPVLQAPPWTGDFDGMLKRRHIRALVAYSKTQFYVVKGVQ